MPRFKRPRSVLNASQSETIDQFITAYDQLHEHNRFEVKLSSEEPPYRLALKRMVQKARLLTQVGEDDAAKALLSLQPGTFI